MWEGVFETVATSGVFAVLFVSLLCYLLQDSRKREAKYNKIIETLTDRLEVVEDIRKKLDEITEKPSRKTKKVDKKSVESMVVEEVA